MSLKVGELFLLGFRGPKIPPWLTSFAEEFGLGGVILFDYDCLDKKYERNVFNPQQVKELCAEIHALPSKPLIFVDQEGGKVRRLKDKYGFKPLPSAKQFGTLSAAERMMALRPSFQEMKAVGIDVNLAPVVDTDSATNPDLGAVERCYSPDVEVIEQCANAMIEVSHEMGLKLCLKHFPGCGKSKANAHNQLMDLSEMISDDQVNLFKRLLPHVPMILLSHGMVKQWEDGLPVSLSPVAVHKLRQWVPETLVLTDDLQMEGLQLLMSTGEACLRAVKAGVDLLCIGHNMRDEQEQSAAFARSILTAASSDPVMKQNIIASIQRMQKIKGT